MAVHSSIRRRYSISDADMFQFCNQIHGLLEENLADFTAFDAMLNASFAQQYAQLLIEVRDIGTDSFKLYNAAQNTADLNAELVKCRDAVLLNRYFVKIAFVTEPGVLAEFGFNEYAASNRNHEKMIQFMTNLYQTTVKYETQLQAVGYLIQYTSQLLALKNQLQALKTLQLQSRGNRYTTTGQRITISNQLWGMCSRVCRAGKLMYSSNYGMYQFFLAPVYHKSKKVIGD